MELINCHSPLQCVLDIAEHRENFKHFKNRGYVKLATETKHEHSSKQRHDLQTKKLTFCSLKYYHKRYCILYSDLANSLVTYIIGSCLAKLITGNEVYKI